MNQKLTGQMGSPLVAASLSLGMTVSVNAEEIRIGGGSAPRKCVQEDSGTF